MFSVFPLSIFFSRCNNWAPILVKPYNDAKTEADRLSSTDSYEVVELEYPGENAIER